MKNSENQIYFHIGYHRTGTTFLQKHILPQLVDSALLLLPGRENDHLRRYLIDQKWDKSNDTAPLKKILQDSTKTVIFTGEGLSGDLYNDKLNMPERIYKIFPKAKILITLRSQYSIIPSMYEYVYLKAGGYVSYKKYLQEIIDNDKFNYQKIICEYKKVFGDSAVKIMLYEDLKNNQNAFIKNILQFMQLPVDVSIGVDKSYRLTRYGSITIKGIRLINFFYSFYDSSFIRSNTPIHPGKFYALLKNILQKMDSIFNKINFIKYKNYEDTLFYQKLILDHYKESNNKLSTKLKININSYNYPS